jgi:hypothetical protein
MAAVKDIPGLASIKRNNDRGFNLVGLCFLTSENICRPDMLIRRRAGI